MCNKGLIKLTVLFDGQFWLGIFERNSAEGYSVAKYTFGSEPSEPVLYDFILKQTDYLLFTTPSGEEKEAIKKKNPKRMKREARKAMEDKGTITKAHEAMKNEEKKCKTIIKQKNSQEKREDAMRKFLLKQQKRKEKKKGH